MWTERKGDKKVRLFLNEIGSSRGRWSRKAFALLAVLLMASLVLAACGSSNEAGTTAAPSGDGETTSNEGGIGTRAPGAPASDQKVPLLKVGFALKVSNLDQSVPTGSFADWLASLALEPLLVVDEHGKLQPWLAEEWSQPSPTVYEYKLRKGVKFTDGNELTAEDVAFSWNYYRRPAAAITAAFYTTVKSIRPKDRYTVVVTLKQPDAAWQFTPAIEASEVFEKKFFEESQGKYGQPGTLVVGTGPWKFDSLNPTSGAEVSANPDYWGGKVPIERISIKFFSNENSMALALRAGEIDIAPSVADVSTFESVSGGATLTSGPSCLTGFFSMPTQTPPWNDVHVRRAVAHVLNRDNIVSASGFSAEPAETLIAKSELLTLGSEGEVDEALGSLPSYELNLKQAKEELAKSAYPEGFETDLVTFDYGTFLAVDQVIAEELKQIGINVHLNNVGQNAWFAALTGPPDKRPLTYTTTGTCTPDPSTYNIFLGKENLAEGNFNAANYAPSVVDKLIAEGLSISDPGKRLTVYTELLDNLAVNLPYIPLYVQNVTFASNSYEWPGYGGYWHDRPWALELVPR